MFEYVFTLVARQVNAQDDISPQRQAAKGMLHALRTKHKERGKREMASALPRTSATQQELVTAGNDMRFGKECETFTAQPKACAVIRWFALPMTSSAKAMHCQQVRAPWRILPTIVGNELHIS